MTLLDHSKMLKEQLMHTYSEECSFAADTITFATLLIELPFVYTLCSGIVVLMPSSVARVP